MNYHNKLIHLFVISIFGLSLSGCSGEPSTSDIEKAVKAASVNAYSLLGSDNAADLLKIHELKKLGCAKEQGGIGYNCEYEIDSEGPNLLMGGAKVRTKTMHKARFVKGSDGWVISN